jgi:hypothetical protein
MPWEWPAGAACAFVLALITTPAGVSGAVLLLPIQLSVLHVASPAVTPTNLLFNVAATPGGLLRFWHERRRTGSLVPLLVAGTLPGVVAGAVIRVELLAGSHAFMLVAAGVLLPLGLWLLLGSQRTARAEPQLTRGVRAGICLTALLVGCAGGIYGIGGGSILSPVLIGAGRPAAEVAPAALASTFVTSIAGVATFTILSVHHPGSVAPDWPTGVALGLGGLAGGYTGARIQARLPDTLIRRIVGVLVLAIGARYLWSGLS